MSTRVGMPPVRLCWRAMVTAALTSPSGASTTPSSCSQPRAGQKPPSTSASKNSGQSLMAITCWPLAGDDVGQGGKVALHALDGLGGQLAALNAREASAGRLAPLAPVQFAGQFAEGDVVDGQAQRPAQQQLVKSARIKARGAKADQADAAAPQRRERGGGVERGQQVLLCGRVAADRQSRTGAAGPGLSG